VPLFDIPPQRYPEATLAVLALLWLFMRLDRWTRARMHRDTEAMCEAEVRAEAFNAEYPACVFTARAIRRRGRWVVALTARGKRRPSVCMP
jgi:hypothetical protein